VARTLERVLSTLFPDRRAIANAAEGVEEGKSRARDRAIAGRAVRDAEQAAAENGGRTKD
jgi:hypothetical protein